MTIEQGLKLKPAFYIPHYGIKGVEIPGVGRNDLPKFLFDRGCRVGVEIGTDKGEYGISLCQAGLKVFGIDSYVNYPGFKMPGQYENHYPIALKNLKGYDYKIIKKFSHEAVADFKDRSLDFVYIDGNHTLPYVVQDIFDWETKLKVGGIMSGHDYGFIYGPGERKKPKIYDGSHVRGAVDICAYIMRVGKLYILGKRTEKGRDKWRSWFWIKQ